MIQIIEKPDYISFDDIHDLLYRAHKDIRDHGIDVYTASLTGKELEAYLSENYKCFVALNKDKLIGTATVELCNGNRWFSRGHKTAYYTLLAVDPAYRGCKLAIRLIENSYRTK